MTHCRRARDQVLAFPLLLLGACGATSGESRATSSASASSSSGDVAALLQADRDFSSASVSGGAAAAFGRYLSENAVELPNGAEPTVGRALIVASLAADGSGEKDVLRWAPERADASGDLGYTWGRFTLTITAADGTSSVHEGKYVTLWRRQPDGSWKVVLDMGNKSPVPDAGLTQHP